MLKESIGAGMPLHAPPRLDAVEKDQEDDRVENERNELGDKSNKHDLNPQVSGLKLLDEDEARTFLPRLAMLSVLAA